MKAPNFWQNRDSMLAALLSPLGEIYAGVTERRLAKATPWRAPIPVICIGNLVAGGTGKTPVARDLAARLTARGRHPQILSRGYGGRQAGPVQVDPARHRASDVGDEPLLLARDAPCWVAHDRKRGAQAIVDAGGDIILMDDGLQNPSLAQDLKLLVVDGETGFGNGRVIPAGPLREHLEHGLRRVDAVIIVGQDRTTLAASLWNRLPVLHARVEPSDPERLAGVNLVAFAGIGRPQKFRAMLDTIKSKVAGFRNFPDHHRYSEGELKGMARDAERLDATLVTTEKDWVRLPPAWRERVTAVPIVLRWHDEAALDKVLAKVTAGA